MRIRYEKKHEEINFYFLFFYPKYSLECSVGIELPITSNLILVSSYNQGISGWNHPITATTPDTNFTRRQILHSFELSLQYEINQTY